MNDALQGSDDDRSDQRRNARNQSATYVSLSHALRTLRRIRQRYEKERTAHPDVLCNLHVALGDSDMNWIDAAIEAIQKPIAAGATDAAGEAAQGSAGFRLLRI